MRGTVSRNGAMGAECGSDVCGRETQFCELERHEGRCGRLGRARMRGTVSRNGARGAAGGSDVCGRETQFCELERREGRWCGSARIVQRVFVSWNGAATLNRWSGARRQERFEAQAARWPGERLRA